MIDLSEVPFRAGFEHADTSDIEFDDKTRQFKLVYSSTNIPCDWWRSEVSG